MGAALPPSLPAVCSRRGSLLPTLRDCPGNGYADFFSAKRQTTLRPVFVICQRYWLLNTMNTSWGISLPSLETIDAFRGGGGGYGGPVPSVGGPADDSQRRERERGSSAEEEEEEGMMMRL